MTWLPEGDVGSKGGWWAGVALDVRHAFRGLRHRPGGALAAVLTLGLGIGATTLVASVARTVLLDPLPYPESHRLVQVTERHEGRERRASPAGYLDWRRELRSFTSLAAYRTPTVVLEADGRLLREEAGMVSGNFFETLGAEPALGRSFDPALRLDGGAREVVVGHGFWTEHLGGSPSVLGSVLRVDGEAMSVVGVMPRDFAFPSEARLWVRAPHEVPPVGDLGPDVVGIRDAWYFEVLGRLAPGVSLGDARRETGLLSEDLLERHPENAPDQGLVLRGLKEATVASGRPLLLLLLAAVGLVLVATCANVAALTLIRSFRERRETTVRAALGASGWRNARLVMLRTLLVAGGGGVLGIVAAALALPLLRIWLPASVPRLEEASLDTGALALAVGLTALATLACAVLPARRAAAVSGRPGDERQGTGPGRSSAALVGVEVALAVVLLSSTVLLARSVAALAEVDPGFRPDGLVTLRVDLVGMASLPLEAQRAEWRRIVDLALAVPGISVAALSSEDPVSLGSRATVRVEGPGGFEDGPDAAWRPTTPEWFRTAGLALLAGRGIEPRDTEGTMDVAVVDQALAAAAFGEGVDPLGRRLTIGLDGHDTPLTVVGVVAAARNRGGDQPPLPVLYRPLDQVSRTPVSGTLAARVQRGGEASAVDRLRDALLDAGGDVLVYGAATGDDLLLRHGGDRRFLLQLLALFAGLSLFLGAVGVYAVAAGLVAARTRELGVRRALGADVLAVSREVLKSGGSPVLFGLAAGLGGAVVAGRALGGFLYGVRPVDPVTLLVVVALLALTALAALAGPALRAVRVDPLVALRDQ